MFDAGVVGLYFARGGTCDDENFSLFPPLLAATLNVPETAIWIERPEVRLKEAHKMQWLGEVSALQEGLRHIADKSR